MAPPTKLSPELHERILNFVRGGAYIETAAAAAGVSKQTLYTWLRKGSSPDAPEEFRLFAAEVQQALAADELRSVFAVEKLANTETATRQGKCTRCGTMVKVPVPTVVQLQAVTWKLERKYPERYGNTLKIEHRTKERLEEMLEAVRPRMSEGAFDELVRALEAELGEPPVAEPPALPASVDDDSFH